MDNGIRLARRVQEQRQHLLRVYGFSGSLIETLSFTCTLYVDLFSAYGQVFEEWFSDKIFWILNFGFQNSKNFIRFCRNLNGRLGIDENHRTENVRNILNVCREKFLHLTGAGENASKVSEGREKKRRVQLRKLNYESRFFLSDDLEGRLTERVKRVCERMRSGGSRKIDHIQFICT